MVSPAGLYKEWEWAATMTTMGTQISWRALAYNSHEALEKTITITLGIGQTETFNVDMLN